MSAPTATAERGLATLREGAQAASRASGRELPLEVSWGCAAAPARGSLDEALAEADRGLYGDKADGLSATG